MQRDKIQVTFIRMMEIDNLIKLIQTRINFVHIDK
jgi:hypothetical protein